MEIRSREIIKAINEKRIEKKIRILWPDSEVYEHLKQFGHDKLSLLYDYCTMNKLKIIKTNPFQYLESSQILQQKYTHIAVNIENVNSLICERVILILSQRFIAVDELTKLRTCWRMNILQFSNKVSIWAISLKKNHLNSNQEQKIITPYKMKERKNFLYVEIEIQNDSTVFQEVKIIGSHKKPSYGKFYYSDSLPQNCFTLYQFKMYEFQSWLNSQVEDYNIESYMIKFPNLQTERRSSFWIPSSHQKSKENRLPNLPYKSDTLKSKASSSSEEQKSSDFEGKILRLPCEQKEFVEIFQEQGIFKQYSLDFLQKKIQQLLSDKQKHPKKQERQQKEQPETQRKLDQLSKTFHQYEEEEENDREGKSEEKERQQVEFVFLQCRMLEHLIQKKISREILLKWNPSLQKKIISSPLNIFYEYIRLTEDNIAQKHLQYISEALIGNLEMLKGQKQSKDMLVMCHICSSLQLPYLIDIFMFQSLYNLHYRQWAELWQLMIENESRMQYFPIFKKKLLEFFIENAQKIVNTISFQIYFSKVLKQRKETTKTVQRIKLFQNLFTSCLTNLSNYNALQSLLQLMALIDNCQTITEYTSKIWNSLKLLDPLECYMIPKSLLETCENFVSANQSALPVEGLQLNSFHFKIQEVPENCKVIKCIQKNFSLPGKPKSNKKYVVTLPLITCEKNQFKIYLQFGRKLKLFIQHYTGLGHLSEEYDDNFSNNYSLYFFDTSVNFIGQDSKMITRARQIFLSLFLKGEKVAVKFLQFDLQQDNIIELLKSLVVKVTISSDKIVYPQCLQYLCADWKNIFKYEQIMDNHRKKEINERMSSAQQRKGYRKRDSERIRDQKNYIYFDEWKHEKIILKQEYFSEDKCLEFLEDQNLVEFCHLSEHIFIQILSSNYLQVQNQVSLLLLVACYYGIRLKKKQQVGQGLAFLCLRYENIPFGYLLKLLLNRKDLYDLPVFLNVVKSQFRKKQLGIIDKNTNVKVIPRIKSKKVPEIPYKQELELAEEEKLITKLMLMQNN